MISELELQSNETSRSFCVIDANLICFASLNGKVEHSLISRARISRKIEAPETA